MSVLPVLYCTDPLLRQRSIAVESPTSPETRALCADLIETMRAADGAGLAAVQVGELKRILVTGNFAPQTTTGARLGVGGERIYINPTITARSQETYEFEEGCLSMPGVFFKVPRHRWIEVSWVKPDGSVHQERFDAFAAVCLQHEIDHLDGVRNVDRLSRLKRDMLLKKSADEQRRRARLAMRPTPPAARATL